VRRRPSVVGIRTAAVVADADEEDEHPDVARIAVRSSPRVDGRVPEPKVEV